MVLVVVVREDSVVVVVLVHLVVVMVVVVVVVEDVFVDVVVVVLVDVVVAWLSAFCMTAFSSIGGIATRTGEFTSVSTRTNSAPIRMILIDTKIGARQFLYQRFIIAIRSNTSSS